MPAGESQPTPAMNKLLPLLLVLLASGVSPLFALGRGDSADGAASPIVFNGLIVQDGKTTVALYNPNTGETTWVQVGKHYGSYTVGYEPGLPASKQTPATNDTVLLTLGGNVQRIPLQDSKIITAVVAPTGPQTTFAEARAVLADALARALGDPNADPRLIQLLVTSLDAAQEPSPTSNLEDSYVNQHDDRTTESVLTNPDGSYIDTLLDANGKVASLHAFSGRGANARGIYGYTDEATSYHESGKDKDERGDLDGAIADYDKAIALNPNYVQAYSDRGLSKEFNGDLTGAIADYDMAIALAPKESDAYYYRGTVKEAKGDYTGALADFVKSHSLFRNGNEDYLRFSLFLTQRLLHRDDGLAELAGAVADMSDGYWGKKVGLYLTGALPEKDFLAQAAQGTIIRVSEAQCEAYYYVGMTRLIAGDTAAAKGFFEKCLATNVTNFFEFFFARAELARLTGQK